MEARGQDPLWMIGDHAILFPQEATETIRKVPLPTSFNAEIPDEYEYHGLVAQVTQNIQYDDKGNLLFFIIDGNVYNHDGLLIGDAAPGYDLVGENCQTCLVAGVDMAIIPVPGSCTQFYIVSAYQVDAQGTAPNYYENRIRAAILDMSLRSDFTVYDMDCDVPVNGKFLTTAEQELQSPSLVNLGSYVQGTIKPSSVYAVDLNLSTAQDGPLAFDVVALPEQNRYVMAIRAQFGLYFLFMDIESISLWDPPGPGIGYPFLLESNVEPFPVIYNVQDAMTTARGYRSQLTAHRDGNTLQVAFSSYIEHFNSPVPVEDNEHELKVTYWEFTLPPSGQPASMGFPMVPGYNPRTYGLDRYPIFPPSGLPMDAYGTEIPWPAVGGLQFSPNGQYLYFTKSTNFLPIAYPSQPGSTFGYIDLTVPCTPNQQPPCPFFQFLPIASPPETMGLTDTRLGINVGPNGTGTALYMMFTDGTAMSLAAFMDPDQPNAANWIQNALPIEWYTARSDAGNAVEYRQLTPRPAGDQHIQRMKESTCCDDLVLARDRSTTITTDCDLTWQPGNNAFWNTSEPIHVATELRIQAGAHVEASNLQFRFGENAVLVIEPGASLKCTNCTFTNACPNTRWKGIEVRGTPTQHQFGQFHPTYQGELDLQASLVENAEVGILAATRPSMKGTGAMINCAAATVWENTDTDPELEEVYKRTIVRNCREGLKFYPYQNFSPGTGAPLHNRSRFYDVLFTVNVDMHPNYDFLRHAYMWRVDGIPYIACTFENTIYDAYFSSLGSAGLGHGIYSLDANYRVLGKCDIPWPGGGPPCPESSYTRSTFTGLDHGIHASQSTTLRNFTVDRAQFTDNIAGVYVDGVVGYVVKNSNFSIGNRNVAMTNSDEQYWWNHHRGIFSTKSYGFTVDDNTLYLSPGSPTDRLTEGVVIGYSTDHNDYVFRNHGSNLSVGFAGEGVSASLEASYTPIVGLQMICNTNDDNAKNLSSRKAEGAPLNELPTHTIRGQQGDFWRQADNAFDNWPQGLDDFKDYEVTTSYTIIKYWHQGGAPQEPLSVDNYLAPYLMDWPPLANNCDFKIPLTVPPGGGMVLQDVLDYLEGKKLAYGNVRYLYEQLLDGGSTDAVVDEITESWPQEAYALRQYLLDRSPYLSVEVLKEVNLQNKLPQAMYAEVCIANPEATQTEGFYTWLENEAPYPLTEPLLAAIVASWDERTYRSTLEAQLGGHHAAMSQAANVMLELIAQDEETYDVTALRGVWQEIRTPGARLAEALCLLDQGDYTAATSAVELIATEHEKLDPRGVAEANRMLGLINILQAVAIDGRGEDELTTAEQDALVTLIDGQQDRPATWAQNLLCFHYGNCTPPWTGNGGEPKSLPRVKPDLAEPIAALTLQPNPTSNWSVAKVTFGSEGANGELRVLDVTGKQVASYRVADKQAQVVLDTRTFGAGAYTVVLMCAGAELGVEKLIVQP